MEDPMLGGGDVILTSAKPKTGFPFDDSDPPSFPRTRTTFRPFRHHFDDIASRHPEFAEHLRPWTNDFPNFENTPNTERHSSFEHNTEPNSSSAQTSSKSSSSNTNTEAQKPPRHNIPNYGLRNTVDLGEKQKQEADLDEKVRNQRSMSAPPDNRSNPSQQRFVSRVNIEPHDPTQNMSGNNTNQTKSSESQQSQQKPNIRHIPIFVEGRDEPILPKNIADEVDSNYTKSPHQQTKFPDFHKEAPKTHHVDEHFDQPFPSGFYHPPRTAQPFTPFHQAAPSAKAHPPQPHEIPIKVQHTRQQQAPPQQKQQPHPQTHPHPQQHQQQQQPPPPPPQPQPQPQPQAQPQQQQQQQQQYISNDPIVKIQEVQKDVNELMNLVEQYSGTSKKDKQYIYLDEMLTRNLIKLDNIDTQGKDTIRQARKEAIKCIQKCISILESKVTRNSEQASQNTVSETATSETMECDIVPPSEQNTEASSMDILNSQPDKMEAEPIQNNTNEPQTLEAGGVVKTGVQVESEKVQESAGDVTMKEVTDPNDSSKTESKNDTTNLSEPNEKIAGDGQESQKKKGKKIIKKKPRSQSTEKSGADVKSMEIDEQKTANSEPIVDDTSQKN